MDATSNSSSVYADELWLWNGTSYEEVVPGGGGGVTEEELNAGLAPRSQEQWEALPRPWLVLAVRTTQVT